MVQIGSTFKRVFHSGQAIFQPTLSTGVETLRVALAKTKKLIFRMTKTVKSYAVASIHSNYNNSNCKEGRNVQKRVIFQENYPTRLGTDGNFEISKTLDFQVLKTSLTGWRRLETMQVWKM